MVKRLNRKMIYKDDWMTLYRDEVQYDDCSRGYFSWTERKNGVGIVVITSDNNILLNKEYRYIVNEYSWEIPGGGIEDHETPEMAAVRELNEETGIQNVKLEKVNIFYPLNSFNTETVTLFYTVLEDTIPTFIKTEAGEIIVEQKYFSFKEALRMIDDGEIIDALTANAIQMIIRKFSK